MDSREGTLRLVAATQADAPEERLDLDSLFRRYAPYVAAIGLRLLGRPDEVDDLVQDVFLASYRGLAALRDGTKVRQWLATVAVRMARRRLRRRRLLAWVGLDLASGREELVACAGSQEQRVLLARVYRVLDELPVQHRIAWLVRYVLGEKLAQTAALCGCSLATTKRHIAAAQAAIEEAFNDE